MKIYYILCKVHTGQHIMLRKLNIKLLSFANNNLSNLWYKFDFICNSSGNRIVLTFSYRLYLLYQKSPSSKHYSTLVKIRFSVCRHFYLFFPEFTIIKNCVIFDSYPSSFFSLTPSIWLFNTARFTHDPLKRIIHLFNRYFSCNSCTILNSGQEYQKTRSI